MPEPGCQQASDSHHRPWTSRSRPRHSLWSLQAPLVSQPDAETNGSRTPPSTSSGSMRQPSTMMPSTTSRSTSKPCSAQTTQVSGSRTTSLRRSKQHQVSQNPLTLYRTKPANNGSPTSNTTWNSPCSCWTKQPSRQRWPDSCSRSSKCQLPPSSQEGRLQLAAHAGGTLPAVRQSKQSGTPSQTTPSNRPTKL
jgi:hypothetical protein